MTIIIVQSDDYARSYCIKTIYERLSWKVHTFHFLSRGDGVPELLTPGERQLFITGSRHGQTKHIPAFVSKLRGMNAELVCMSYSVSSLPGPFDYVIKKEGGADVADLFAAIEGFLSGQINRREQVANEKTEYS
ncbi:MAG: hypothetical protein Q7R65_00260 [bacterium]|nr:hypothetical protein [bacterium]